MTVPLFRAEHITRVFGRSGRGVRAVDDVSLDVVAGERLGILGESGSGKSTLVRLLAALDRPTSGTVSFRGIEVSRLPERELGGLRASVQMVFQDPRSSLDPRMRARDIVAEPLRAPHLRLARPDRERRVAEVLEAVGLSPALADRFPHEFSGGQRQRIAIARALAPKPSVLIADEPLSALDVSVRGQILNLLNDLVAHFGLTLIFVSHDLGVVRHACDRVAVLRAGRLEEVGATSEVYANPSSPYTRALLEAVPRMRF